MNDVFVGLTVPIRLIGSHGINKPGFESARHGVFVSRILRQNNPIEEVAFSSVRIFGINCDTFSISTPSNDKPDAWQTLTISFEQPQKSDEIEKFLQNIAIGLTALHAPRVRDAWYGNLVVDIGWPALNLNKAITVNSGIDPHVSTKFTSKDCFILNSDILSNLKESEYSDIFVDGMRANQPKAKYASWFIMIEEIERMANKELKSSFTPLLSEETKTKMINSSELTGESLSRVRGILGNSAYTIESRSKKLHMILTHIGITEINSIKDTKITVDIDLCKDLIDTRNRLAHKGQSINQDLLYNILYPLSLRLLQYLNG